jgi:hypothetical protein
VTVIPDLFKAATSAYIGRMSRLAEKPVTIDRGLALKLALAERTNRANLPMESMAQLTGGENISAGEVKARSIVAMAIILDQLKRIDPAYVEHAKAIEPQSLAAREKYRGIHLRVA